MIYDLIFNTETLLTTLALHGHYFYWVLGAIVFAETGFFFAAFLPGDSLLFLAGMVSASANLDHFILSSVLITAAVLGNIVNYYTGRWLGTHVYRRYRFIDRSALKKAKDFFKKYGSISIVLARFVPFLRTLVPFLCGISLFSTGTFVAYSIIGAIVWVLVITSLGYYLGNWWFIKEYVSIMILVTMAITITPPALYLFRKKSKNTEK